MSSMNSTKAAPGNIIWYRPTIYLRGTIATRKSSRSPKTVSSIVFQTNFFQFRYKLGRQLIGLGIIIMLTLLVTPPNRIITSATTMFNNKDMGTLKPITYIFFVQFRPPLQLARPPSSSNKPIRLRSHVKIMTPQKESLVVILRWASTHQYLDNPTLPSSL
jgi:hypothetical protein